MADTIPESSRQYQVTGLEQDVSARAGKSSGGTVTDTTAFSDRSCLMLTSER